MRCAPTVSTTSTSRAALLLWLRRCVRHELASSRPSTARCATLGHHWPGPPAGNLGMRRERHAAQRGAAADARGALPQSPRLLLHLASEAVIGRAQLKHGPLGRRHFARFYAVVASCIGTVGVLVGIAACTGPSCPVSVATICAGPQRHGACKGNWSQYSDPKALSGRRIRLNPDCGGYKAA